MADVELMIKVPEEDYAFIKEQVTKMGITNPLKICIANGIPLPKGRGRIGDLDKLIKTMKERNNDNGGKPLNAVDRGYDLAYQHMVEEAKGCVIIEADNTVFQKEQANNFEEEPVDEMDER